MTRIQWILYALWMIWPAKQCVSALVSVTEASNDDRVFFGFYIFIAYSLSYFVVRAWSLSLARLWRRTGHAVKQSWATGLSTFALLFFTAIVILQRSTLDLTWLDFSRQIIGAVILFVSIVLGILTGRLEAGISRAAEENRTSRKRFNFDKGLILAVLFLIIFVVMYGHLNVTRLWDMDLSVEEDTVADEQPSGKHGPNVLLITLDGLASYNVSATVTPTLMKLAGDGAFLPDTRVPVPLTGPSHVTLFTGKSPQDHGVLSNANRLSPDIGVMQEIFRDAGYDTAAFTNFFSVGPTHFSRGFNTFFNQWRSNSNVNKMLYGMDLFWMSDKQFASYNYRRKRHPLPEHENLWLAINWLDRDRRQPFFLWFHSFLPRAPYEAPENVTKKFSDGVLSSWSLSLNKRYSQENIMLEKDEMERLEALYNSDCYLADLSVDQLVKWFFDKGLLENTIVVITASHGETFQGHSSFIGHANVVYEDVVKVPLLVVYPPRIVPGWEGRDPVEFADIMPTILDLAGIEAPDGIAGKSIASALGDPSGQVEEKELLISETFPPEGGSYKLAVRVGEMKYIIDTGTGQEQLYDVQDDPRETQDLMEASKQNPIINGALEELRNKARERIDDPGTKKAAEISDNEQEIIQQLQNQGYIY